MIVLALLLLAPDALAQAPLPDRELAQLRGGIRLPSGVDVALSVQTQTSVNGNVVLQTVFQADRGPATVTAYAPRSGEVVVASAREQQTAAAANAPVVTFDARSGVTVAPGARLPTTAAFSGNAPPVAAGLERVTDGTVTDNGIIADVGGGAVRTVELQAADLRVAHLTGSAIGSVISNTANDRTIDTVTNVAIDLRNAGPDTVGSAMFRVQDVALDALALRNR